MRFETTQLSSPQFEKDGLRHITIKTSSLPGRGDIVVFVPDSGAVDLPVVLLLHGVYGSAWAWALRGGAHVTAGRMMSSGSLSPMIIAMPSDGLWKDGSFYLPHHGYNFESWIVDDVVDAVRLLIPQAAKSHKTAIAGLSMGGFGALRLGGKYADRFFGISAHSAITHLDQAHHFTHEFIDGISALDRSVFETLKLNREKLPPIRFDCGSDDLLIAYNRELHQTLKENEISHSYEEFSGAHEWSYWEEHLADTLQFFEKCLAGNDR